MLSFVTDVVVALSLVALWWCGRRRCGPFCWCFCHGWDNSFQQRRHVVFLLRCVFFVWSSRSVCLLAYDSCQLEFYVACHWRGGVGRISVNESSTEEKRFTFFQRSNGRFVIFSMFYHCGKRYHTLESILCPSNAHAEPEIPSLFRGSHPCSLDAFVGWLWYINRSKGF